jgi:molybdenum-dependent DNA-binding transcriptional regulator ModE
MTKSVRGENGLTPTQVKAIAALLEKGTVEGAAKAAGVSYITLHRWLNNHDAFQGELRRQEGRLLDAAVRNLAQLQRGAVAAIASALGDKEAPHSVKLRAAEIVFSNLLKMREARDLEDRIAALEALIGQAGGHEH